MLESARDDADRLLRILDSLLDLTRLEAGRVRARARGGSPSGALLRAVADEARLVHLRGGPEARRPRGARPRGGERRRGPAAARVHQPPLERLEVLAGGRDDHARRGARPPWASCASRVRDEGGGIPPEALPRLFDRFYRVPGQSKPGAGIGLAIAREIVVAHGGTIACSSTPAAGTEFHFLRSRVTEAPPAAASLVPPVPDDVEDDVQPEQGRDQVADDAERGIAEEPAARRPVVTMRDEPTMSDPTMTPERDPVRRHAHRAPPACSRPRCWKLTVRLSCSSRLDEPRAAPWAGPSGLPGWPLTKSLNAPSMVRGLHRSRCSCSSTGCAYARRSKDGSSVAADLLDREHGLRHERVVARQGDAVASEDEEQPEHGAAQLLAADREIELLAQREHHLLLHLAQVGPRLGRRQLGRDPDEPLGVLLDGGDPEVREGVAQPRASGGRPSPSRRTRGGRRRRR